MTCIKTGADVYISSHSLVLHGDMFLVGRTYIFHHTGWKNGADIDLEEDHEADYVFEDHYTEDKDALYLDSKNIIAMERVYVREIKRG